MLSRLEAAGQGEGIAALGRSLRREQDLERAAREFETQLLSFLVRGMRRAYLGEEEGAEGDYQDFAESALAGFLADQGGLGLTRGVLERVRALEAGTVPPEPPGQAGPGALPAAGNRRPLLAPAAPSPTALPATAAQPPAAAGRRAEINSGFGQRTDPITREPRLHRGVDLRARRGDEVRAAGDGVVARAGSAPGLGRHVVVRHAGGYETVYAHLDRIGVAPGAEVAAGAALGQAGASGRATGAHLHFEVRVNGQAVDPLELIGGERPQWVWPVAKRERGGVDASG